MRRIEFIAPVAAVRGNMSGKQNLLYPTQNNSAWDAPADQRSYATNYTTRYIGAKRSRDGHTYYAVKQRSAVKMSPAMRLQMAVLASSSVIANILQSNATITGQLVTRYRQTAPEGWTFKRWVMDSIKDALKNKQHFAFKGTSSGAVFVKNPYLSTAAPAGGYSIDQYYPKDLLSKFWMELANNPIQFQIGTLLGIAHEEDTFAIIIAANYNVLNLTTETLQGLAYVKKDALYLQYVIPESGEDEEYVNTNNVVNTSYVYTLTAVAPE